MQESTNEGVLADRKVFETTTGKREPQRVAKPAAERGGLSRRKRWCMAEVASPPISQTEGRMKKEGAGLNPRIRGGKGHTPLFQHL